MISQYFSKLNSVSKIILTLLVVVLVFLFTFFLGVMLVLPFFNVSLTDLDEYLNQVSSQNIMLLKLLQIIQAFGLFIFPALICAFLFGRSIAEYLYLKGKTSAISIVLVIVIIISIVPFINFLSFVNSQMSLPESLSALETWMKTSEARAMQLTESFLNVSTIGGLLLNIFMIAVLPAIGEEFLFRGIIQRLFTEWTKNIHWGVLIAAAIFSGFHMQFYGFIPRLLLGVMFGYMLVWSKSMWLPVLAHFINNVMAVISYYLINTGQISKSVENIGADYTMAIPALISLLISAVVFYLLLKFEKQNKNTITEVKI